MNFHLKMDGKTVTILNAAIPLACHVLQAFLALNSALVTLCGKRLELTMVLMLINWLPLF